jgi:hypothetical protein
MKITKIPGLGRFGVFIDDIDFSTITNEEWMEVGRIHLETLVTIIRTPKIDTLRYAQLIHMWGTPRLNLPLNIYRKYGMKMREALLARVLSKEDRFAIRTFRDLAENEEYAVARVTPKKDEKGKNIGLFGDGELLWHSNECGNHWFTPGVSLMGYESMTGSCTGFLTTPDYYESLPESLQRELDDMVVIHNYKPNSVNPDDPQAEQDSFYKNNMCPFPNSRVPLIIKSPGGIKGIHLGLNTFDRIEGMAKEESDKLFNRIQKELFVDKYQYDHWYQHDGDICLFDNSITLHRRLIASNGVSPNRVGMRIQYDYDKIVPDYNPYYHEEFNVERANMINLYRESINEGKDVQDSEFQF